MPRSIKSCINCIELACLYNIALCRTKLQTILKLLVNWNWTLCKTLKLTLAGWILYETWQERSKIIWPTILKLDGKLKKWLKRTHGRFLSEIAKFDQDLAFLAKISIFRHFRSKNPKFGLVSQIFRQLFKWLGEKEKKYCQIQALFSHILFKFLQFLRKNFFCRMKQKRAICW